MTAPRTYLERVQGGRWLADCDACGTIGVWESRTQASAARKAHVCGKLRPGVIFGPRPGGQ